jgi:hypothetical protein
MIRTCSVLVTALFLLLSWAVPPAADAADPIKTALRNGGERLIDLQNADGGWFFTVGDTDCAGNTVPPEISCKNTFGVTAQGLVSAYRVTRAASMRNAARDTGDALLARYSAAPACDDNVGTAADRPVTADIAFLVSLSGIAKTPVYKKAAAARFACITGDFPDGADRAAERINNRVGQGLDSLGAWDAALDIRAAVAVKSKKYAIQEAKAVIGPALTAIWDVDDPQCPGCEVLGRGLLLAALAPLDSDKTIRTTINDYRDDLLALQQPDGSWNGDTQITAYVVIGLTAIKQNAAIRQAVNEAVTYLLARQNGTGGFDVMTTDTSEITEVDSEVLQALEAAR